MRSLGGNFSLTVAVEVASRRTHMHGSCIPSRFLHDRFQETLAAIVFRVPFWCATGGCPGFEGYVLGGCVRRTESLGHPLHSMRDLPSRDSYRMIHVFRMTPP